MSTVGIITFHRNSNYGTMLQALALQEAISQFGDQAEMIEFAYETKQTKYELLKLRLQRLPVYLLEHRKYIARYRGRNQVEYKEKAFAEFHSQYIKVSNRNYCSVEDLYNDPPLYDGYVVGSDQTWNPYVGANSDVFYLSFTPKDAWRGSYAPSIAVSSLTSAQAERLKRLSSGIKFLSCREESGSGLLRELTGRTVKTVLDPTLLLSAKDWMKFATPNAEAGPYILQYFLGDNPWHRKFVKRVSNQTGWKIISIPVDYSDFNDNTCSKRFCGPDKFLSLIQNAKLVCTDSFHGTIFSINFNVPFFAFRKFSDGEQKSENARLIDILSTLNLCSRLVDDVESLPDINDLYIDFQDANQRLVTLRKSSLDYLQSMLLDLQNSKHIKIKQCEPVSFEFETDCYSCGACQSVCPGQAITASKNSDGCFIPSVNLEHCIKCGKCVQVCPKMQAQKPKNLPTTCNSYAAYCTDSAIRLNSSSGGIFTLLARETVKKGGYVCGCIFDFNIFPKHIVSNKSSDLLHMMGSKYVHSSMEECYEPIRVALDAEKDVLFSGVPCQVAAVRNVFGNNPHLYCVAVVCHGSISRTLWKKYIKEEEKNHGKIISCNMRDKTHGWTNYGLKFRFENQTEHIAYRSEDGYLLKCYTDGWLERERCLSCQYKGDQIHADLLIGDGWNSNTYFPVGDDGNGVSMIFCLTEHGQNIWDQVSSDLIFEPVPKEVLCENNARILTPESRRPELAHFRMEINQQTAVIGKILNKYANPSILVRLIRKIKYLSEN